MLEANFGASIFHGPFVEPLIVSADRGPGAKAPLPPTTANTNQETAFLMALTVAARLAVVEERMGVFHDTQTEMAADVRVVRDYVLAEQERKAVFRRVFAGIIAVLAAVGAFAKAFSGFHPK